MNHVCARCETTTNSLSEHRSEVDDSTFHPECCPGGCDSPADHVGLPVEFMRAAVEAYYR